MVVVCQSRSIRLRIVGDDNKETIVRCASRAEKKELKAFYERHGFKVK